MTKKSHRELYFFCEHMRGHPENHMTLMLKIVRQKPGPVKKQVLILGEQIAIYITQ